MVSKAADHHGSDFLCFLFMYYCWFVNSNSQIMWKIEASTSPGYIRSIWHLCRPGEGDFMIRIFRGVGNLNHRVNFMWHLYFARCYLLQPVCRLWFKSIRKPPHSREIWFQFPRGASTWSPKIYLWWGIWKTFWLGEGGNLGVALGDVEASIWPIHNDHFFVASNAFALVLN